MSRPVPEHSGWADFVARYGVGDVLEGDVVGVVPFGAFVRVGDDVEGLAHSDSWPSVPQTGTRVRVTILAIDPQRRRVALGPA